MMKIITIFFCLSVVVLKSQQFTKSTEDFKSEKGNVYKVGDRIIIAMPQDFSNEYSYYTQGKDRTIKKEAVSTFYIDGVSKTIDRRYKLSAKIKHFKKNPSLGTFAVTDIIFNDMIQINNAEKTGEILSTQKILDIYGNNPIVMNDSISYLCMLSKEKKITKEHAKEYLYLFNKKKYNAVREDEFEFYSEINSTIDTLNKKKQSPIFSDTLQIILKLELGNYDFEKEGFPILWTNSKHRILSDFLESLTPEDIKKEKIDLTELKIKFTNEQDFSFIKLSPNKANYFVKHRKDHRGNVDRNVFLFAHILLNDVILDQSLSDMYSTEKTLITEITKLKVFEDKESYYYLNTVTPK